MVTRLRLTRPIRHDQTLLSYVGELALMNFQPSTDDFCRDMNTSLHRVAMGDDRAIADIARLSGSDPDDVLQASFRHGKNSSLVYRGQKLTSQVRVGPQVRFCAECLREDIAAAAAAGMRHPHHHAYGRPQWHVAQIGACVRHEIELNAIPTARGYWQHDFAGAVAPVLDHLDTIVAAARRRQAHALEVRLSERMTAPGTGFLDGLGFSVTARFCEVLGSVALFGPRPLNKGIRDDQWSLGGAAGYDIASGGPEKILSFLSELKDRGNQDSRDGPHNDWGILYNWFEDTRDTELEPLLELVRDHIEETYPLGAGRKLLGRRVEERKMHSVTSASVEYGLHPVVMRNQLAACGVIENDPAKFDNQILFPARPNRLLLERLARGITAVDSQKRINCDRQVFGPLTDAGYLAPIVAVETGNSLFDTEDLDRFVQRLSVAAVAYSSKPAGLETITATRMKLTCSHVEIVGLILAGKLANLGRLEAERGYAAILVDPVEIAPHVRGQELGGIMVSLIPADLGFPHSALEQMLDRHLATAWRMHPRRRCLQRVVDDEVYARFKAKYVSLRDLSLAAAINSKRHMVALRSRGIVPEPEFPGNVHLYLRERIR